MEGIELFIQKPKKSNKPKKQKLLKTADIININKLTEVKKTIKKEQDKSIVSKCHSHIQFKNGLEKLNITEKDICNYKFIELEYEYEQLFIINNIDFNEEKYNEARDEVENCDKCVCGVNIKNLFYFYNKLTNHVIVIGSTCINKFTELELFFTCKLCNNTTSLTNIKKHGLCKDCCKINCIICRKRLKYDDYDLCKNCLDKNCIKCKKELLFNDKYCLTCYDIKCIECNIEVEYMDGLCEICIKCKECKNYNKYKNDLCINCHKGKCEECLTIINTRYELCYMCKFKDEIIYLAVPFSDKEEAKRLGAKWDGNTKQWYAPNREEELVNNKKWQIKNK